ncbi:MAG: hypothetical protein J6T26_01685, partial [Firmicutes bacterium]|nr:hypothetical protein [Bacillota bacterium]
MAYWGTTAKLNEKKGQTALSLDNSALNVRDYDNERLNKKYSDTIKLLNNLNKKTGANRDVIQDANSLMDEYIGTIKKSYNLNGGNLNKNFLTIGKSSFDKALKNMVWDYQYSNQTHEQYQQALQGLSYQPQSAITAKNQQNVIDLAKKKGLTGLTKEEEETARMYEDAARHGGNPGKLINGITGLTEATLTPDGQDMINPYRLDAKTREKYGKEAEALRAKGQITYDMADAYLKNDPAYAFAQDHAGDLTNYSIDFERIGEIAKIVGQNGAKSLTEQEYEVYENALPMIGQITGGKTMQELDDADRNKLSAWGASYANELRGLNGVFSAYQPTDEQQFILKKDRETPEGAKQWRDEAAGTAEEEAAKDNLWFVEHREYYKQVPNMTNFSIDSMPDAEFHSNDQYIDNAYKVINGFWAPDNVEDARQYGTLTLMDDDEKGIFNYLASSGDTQQAKEYLDYIQYALNERANINVAQHVQDVASNGVWGSVIESLASVPASLTRGLGAFDIYLQQFRNLIGDYRPIDYQRGQTSGIWADTARETVMQNYDWKANILGRDVDIFDTLYSTLMSGVDSYLAGALGQGLSFSAKGAGKAAGLILGSGAAQDTMMDIHNRGGNNYQVLVGGTLAGFFEGFFEDASIEKLFKDMNGLGKRKFKDRIKNIGKEMLTNFSEEFNTEAADIIMDYMLMGDLSDYNTMVNEYERLGMDPDAAKAKATEELVMQAFDAGLSGALMGAGFGEIANINANYQTGRVDKATGDVVKTETKDTLKTFSEQLGGKAAELGKEYDPKKASNKQTGELVRTIFGQVTGEYSDTLLDRIAVDLHDAGAGFDAARSIAKMMAGQELSPEEIQTLAKDQQAMQVMYETFGGGQKQERGKKNLPNLNNNQEMALDGDALANVGPLPGYGTDEEEKREKPERPILNTESQMVDLDGEAVPQAEAETQEQRGKQGLPALNKEAKPTAL